jgi:hypothetical protein
MVTSAGVQERVKQGNKATGFAKQMDGLHI